MKTHLWPIAPAALCAADELAARPPGLLEAKEFGFARAEERFRRAAAGGLARAGVSLADALRARGLDASASGGRVTIEGAGIVVREFGTLTREAQPVVAPVVRAHAQEIVRLVASEIGSKR